MEDRFADCEARIEALERRVLVIETDLARAKACTGIALPLTEQYGEHVTKANAANILGVTRATIYTMLRDGRISATHGGSRVSVRSIERYMRANKGKSGKVGVARERKMKHGADALEET